MTDPRPYSLIAKYYDSRADLASNALWPANSTPTWVPSGHVKVSSSTWPAVRGIFPRHY